MQIQTHPGEIEPLLSPGQMPQHTSKRTGRKWLKVAYLTSKQAKPSDELFALSLGKPRTSKTDEFSEKFRRGGGGRGHF